MFPSFSHLESLWSNSDGQLNQIHSLRNLRQTRQKTHSGTRLCIKQLWLGKGLQFPCRLTTQCRFHSAIWLWGIKMFSCCIVTNCPGDVTDQWSAMKNVFRQMCRVLVSCLPHPHYLSATSVMMSELFVIGQGLARLMGNFSRCHGNVRFIFQHRGWNVQSLMETVLTDSVEDSQQRWHRSAVINS